MSPPQPRLGSIHLVNWKGSRGTEHAPKDRALLSRTQFGVGKYSSKMLTAPRTSSGNSLLREPGSTHFPERKPRSYRAKSHRLAAGQPAVMECAASTHLMVYLSPHWAATPGGSASLFTCLQGTVWQGPPENIWVGQMLDGGMRWGGWTGKWASRETGR